MKIGVRAHDYGKMTPEALAETLAQCGYECTQLALPKAIAGIDAYSDISPECLERIHSAFHKNRVEITVFGCYMDLANPDAEIRNYAISTLKKCLAYSKIVGAKVVGTETSYAWLNSEEKKARYSFMVDGLLRVVEEAAKLDAKLAIEPVYLHPLDSLEVVQAVMETVADEDHLRMIFDASNLLQFPETTDQDQYWTSWLHGTGKYIEAMHIKDFILNEQRQAVGTPLGQGVIRYDAISKWLHKNRPDMPILREEMNPSIAAADIAFMRSL